MENLPTPSRNPSGFRRPAIVLDKTAKSADSLSSDASDGVHFRKPMAPLQMTISPGNAANEDKLVAKLKSLELSRKKATRSHLIDLKTPSKVDLVATERFFVETAVENIPHTPRNHSVRESFRTPAHNIAAEEFPRDSMRSNATYVLTTPRLERGLHPHNDPFTPALATPSRKTNTVVTPLAYDEKLERQFVALSSWANVILDSASFVSEIDLGTSKQDASRKLQEMLTKPIKRSGGNEGVKVRYTDMCLRRKCLDYLKRADSVYQSTPIPRMLKAMVERGEISIKKDIEVYNNIGVQTSILSLLFSLHPFWLFIAVETVCAEFSNHDTDSLDARLPFSSSSFAPATVKFIHDHILANAKYISKNKFASGTVKRMVNPKGKEVLHKHCITCILSMAVLLEYAKNSYLFENTPGLFVKNSEIKTVGDFCTEFSRLVLSASGTPLNKAFDKNSFRRTYRQSFLEEYQYAMKSVRDMADGIILGRLIELLTDSSPLSIIGSMRNPQGDRIRKKGNVEKALTAAAEAGIDVDGISIDQILAAHRESCLDLMWRLVGVYVKKKAEQEPLRRESNCLDGGDVEADITVIGAPLGGIAESAFAVYQQLAFQFGIPFTKWADLENGLLLSSIWQHYNSCAPDIRFYEGETLFDKVANAAESDLGVPLALTALRDERQLGLFAHMFLTRLISYKRLRDSEMSDGESDVSSIVSIIRKEGENLNEETERIQRVRLESERAISAREDEEKRREDELRRRFEREEEEGMSTEWRSPPRSQESSESEEKMLMDDGEEERIEEEMRRVEERKREEEARIEAERLKKEEEERLAEEEKMREEARLEEERIQKEEEERIRLIEEARRKAEEEERLRKEEEERLRRIEESRIKAEEEERLRREKEEEKAALTIQCWIRGVYAMRLLMELRAEREEEERRRVVEEARIKAEEEERIRREDEERQREIQAALLCAEEERLRREKEEEERRERAALFLQCWIRRVIAVRQLTALRAEREERLQKEEEERREAAAIKITAWICDRLAIRAARRELEERRVRREEEEKVKMEEEGRRKLAVLRIESWYSSVLSIRAARSMLLQLREERWRREEEERLERERREKEERERQEEESRRLHELMERSASKIQNSYRGWRLIVKAKEELEMRRRKREEERIERERLRLEEEERIRREEEARLELERIIRMEEEERIKKKMEERLRREEEARIEMERIRMEEEEKFRKEEEERKIREEEMRIEMERLRRVEERLRREEEERRLREEEARLERERIEREEEERRWREEEEARMEIERQLREEEERLKREEEEARLEMERMAMETARRREEEELKEWAAKQKQAKEKEEKIFKEVMEVQRRNEKLVAMRENGAARTIQTAVRSWLPKRRLEKRTIEFIQRLKGTPRDEKSGRRTIGGTTTDDLLTGMREIKRRQRKLSLTLYRTSSLSRRDAATKIQAWWRGVVCRRRHREEIELIGVRMKEYNEKGNKVLEQGSTERAIPVSRRLERARAFLESPLRMYDIKVACYTIMSLCRLSSLYCERAVILSLHSLLIDTFSIQADRSPAFEEIIEFGVHAIEELLKCSSPRVRSSMVCEGTRVVMMSAHQMMAFPKNNVIAPVAMKNLRLCKAILPVESHNHVFEKMYTYFLKKGEEKFGKLPSNDVRGIEFLELKKAFSK